MSLNWKEIDLVLNELCLPGMQIQKLYQSSFDVLVLELYGRPARVAAEEHGRVHRILVSLSPQACRIHETFRAAPKSAKPLRFAEFLKARIVNGRVEEAVQLGDDRVVRIIIRRGENAYRLYIRLWSNAANVILTDEANIILDAMKRLPKRGETGGGVYKPEAARPTAVEEKIPDSGNAPSQHDSPAGPAKAKQYEVRDLPGEGSFNKKVDDWYAEHGGRLSLPQLREEVQRRIGKNRNRLEAALERLHEKEADYAGGNKYRKYGDLILSNTASITQGAAWIEASVAYSDGEQSTSSRSRPRLPKVTEGTPASVAYSGGEGLVRIELDPRKSPAENAAHYYEQYRKAKNGLGELREEIAAGETELARLGETERTLLSEDNPLRLEALLKKLRGKQGGTSSAAQNKRPGLSFADGDWLILVGRDAAENDELLRRHVKGNDLWLHARDWAGSYVFIKNRPGKTVPLDILLDAGNLALFYSKGRNNGKGNLYYTQVKFLRRAKNGPKGLVLPTQEKNLAVTLDDKRLKKLESGRL